MPRKKKESPGTWVKRELFESRAFHSLKGFAPQLLILMLGKRNFDQVGRGDKKKYECINDDSLTLTYIEAKKKYGITKSRFSRAIGELLAKGFIIIKHRGGGYQKDKTIYSLSEKWRIWSPGVVFETRKKETVQRGFCKPKRKVTRENVPIHSRESVPLN